MKETKIKSNKEIAEEWDRIALTRHEQIKSKRDISFHKILLPTLFKIVEEIKNTGISFNKIIDVGCGTGYLTCKLSKYSDYVLGLDISEESIKIAIKEYRHLDNVLFKNISIEDIVINNEINKFDLAVANMVLMDVPNLNDSLAAISKSLNTEGSFLFTITHPYFWPSYWGYNNKDWFNYNEEIFIESNFNITNEKTDKVTSHIHRPLSLYFKLLKENGFKIVDLIEPLPNENIGDMYIKNWGNPRFLVIHCSKEREFKI